MEAPHTPPPLRQNIALLPPPAFVSHLIPFIELAKKLVSHHNCTVTLIIPDDLKTQKSLLQGIPAAISPVFLPPSPAPPESSLDTEMSVPMSIIRSLPALRDVLSFLRDSGNPAAALVVDLFAPDAIDVAREFGIPAYIFYIISACELSLTLDLHKLDEFWSGAAGDNWSIKLPCSIVMKPEDVADSMKDRNSEVYKWILDLCRKYLTADAILVNSFLGLECEAFHELQRRRPHFPPVHPVGPLIRIDSDSSSDHYTLKWLDDQPPKSVLYVSFGSWASLSAEQFTELALGLEMSGHGFLWAVRVPQQNITSATNLNNPLEFLPQGFLERTKSRGLVVPDWAPQVPVLSHRSTGGFLTHCGWNSILEAVVCGVPMIAWPLGFDQKLNAKFLTDGLKAAVRVRENQNGVVERDCVSQVVKQLMEGDQGKKIRDRMMNVKVAAADVMAQEGSSAHPLTQLVNNCWTQGN